VSGDCEAAVGGEGLGHFIFGFFELVGEWFLVSVDGMDIE